MVLGFILYEAVDIVYNVGKLTVNGGKYVYNWYYDIDELNQIENNKDEQIKDLIKRIEYLENKLEDR
tara:strand:+ start:264 stop:464 length:201 start_codon:yes stop_codon:yes gene_type:complete